MNLEMKIRANQPVLDIPEVDCMVLELSNNRSVFVDWDKAEVEVDGNEIIGHFSGVYFNDERAVLKKIRDKVGLCQINLEKITGERFVLNEEIDPDNISVIFKDGSESYELPQVEYAI